MTAKRICRSAIIAAIYAVVTITMAPISFGVVQLRIAEALVILPCLMIEGVWGVTLGCLIANMFSPFGVYDIVFGTMVTLISALSTRFISVKLKGKPLISALPPILLNAFLLPLIWWGFGLDGAYWANVLSIFLSQTIVICAMGVPLYYALKPFTSLYK